MSNLYTLHPERPNDRRKQFQIWSEGCWENGALQPAYFMGYGFGITFRDAVNEMMENVPDEQAQDYDPKRLAFCGSRLFSNEEDAREIYG